MTLLENIIKNILLEESVSINSINDAIDGHKRIIINYKSNGKEEHTGARVIEVYAYGVTKKGNSVIRAFQPYGDTTSRVPSWKLFRIDRITAWKPTKQTFDEPPLSYYNSAGEFNENGDNSMSIVYKIAKFGNKENTSSSSNTKTSQSNNNTIYKTDTERKMEKLRKQLENPIKLSDIKTKNGFKQISNNDQQKPSPSVSPRDRLSKRVAELSPKNSSQQLKDKLSTMQGKNMTMSDLNNILSQNDKKEQNSQDLYKTPTELGMDRLRQQLNNPRKIDLSKIPKR